MGGNKVFLLVIGIGLLLFSVPKYFCVKKDISQLERHLKSAADMWAGRTICFVNPASPEESILTREIYQPRLQGQVKIFGFGIVLGLVLCVVPLLFWAKKHLIGSEVTDATGYWAKPSQMLALNEHAKPITFLFVGGFICFQLFTLPDGVQAKDLWSWVRLALSLLLVMVASVYALKLFLPCIAGRRCRLKLSAPSYKLGDPIRMTLCIGVPLPEGGEAVVTLRCQRPPQGEEQESGKMFIKLFELKKCVSCPVWPEQGGDLHLPLEFIISELDIALWNHEAMSNKDVTWVVLVTIDTPQASYQRGFKLPIQV